MIARAGVQVNIGNLQQGQVVALYNYMAQIIVELIKLASLIITLNKSMACADRVAGILDVKSSMEYKTVAGNDKAADNMAVEFNHVTFTYVETPDIWAKTKTERHYLHRSVRYIIIYYCLTFPIMIPLQTVLDILTDPKIF